MRVIAGKYKGRTLFAPKDQAVRPTTDRIKENVFNLVQGRVAGCRFLDLFGGSGAITAEALSRGAASAVIVDASRDSAELIKKNFAKLGIGREGRILELSYDIALKRLAGETFDLIYLDPPFRIESYEAILSAILEVGVLAEEGLILFEHATERAVPVPQGLRLFDSRKYGSVTIEILSFDPSDE